MSFALIPIFQNCTPVENEAISSASSANTDLDTPVTPTDDNTIEDNETEDDTSDVTPDDPQPQFKFDPSCLDLVWSPSEEEVGNDDKRYGDGEGRTTYDVNGPNNKPSVVSNAKLGEPAALSTLRHRDKEAMKRKSSLARIKTTLFIPENHGFNEGNAKMPLGIWGGDPNASGSNGGVCATAGCPPSRQNGFSIRLTRNLLQEKNYNHGPRLYSYHLNRNGVKKSTKGVDYEYGEGFPMNTQFPLGKWFKIVMDIQLNSFDGANPVADGTMDLYMLNMNDSLIGKVQTEGLIFRDEPSWHIFGPLLADLWGGPYKAKTHIPLKSFKTYYRDYKMYLLKVDDLPTNCK